MRTKLVLLCLFLSFKTVVLSQNTSGNLENYIDDIIDNVPSDSGNDYKNPSITQTNIWEKAINYILNDQLTSARNEVEKIGYQITEFLDNTTATNQTYYVVEKQNNSTNHWGTYIFTKNAVISNLIITAPHILNDINTGQQAVYCLKKSLVKAVFLNGTQRCNSSSFSNCSGTTATCNNGSEQYRISDVAHSDEAIFHLTTKILFENITNSVFIQLHGFGKKEDDPSLILSNGTRDTPSIDYIDLLKNELLVEDSSLTFKIPHQDVSWNRLIAFTNTQGRLINGSSDPCNVHSAETSGRFISFEQEREKLRDDVTGWKKVSNAIDRVFTKALNISTINREKGSLIYPNPTKGKINFRLENIDDVEVYTILGKKVKNIPRFNADKSSFSLTLNQEGVYFIKIISKQKSIFQKVIVYK